MAYEFHNSKVDGTPDQEIVSGQIGSLFTSLTSQERLTGDQEFSKVWITADSDLTSLIGLSNPTDYTSTVFVSASESDVEGDLTGSELRYGAQKVATVGSNYIDVEDNVDYTLMRSADVIIIAGATYTIDTVVDNTNGTHRVTTTTALASLPSVGDYVTSTFALTLITATPKPFWREEKVTAGAAWYGEYATAEILIAD